MIVIAILAIIYLRIAQVVCLLMSWCMGSSVGVMVRAMSLILVMERWYVGYVRIIYKAVTLVLPMTSARAA